MFSGDWCLATCNAIQELDEREIDRKPGKNIHDRWENAHRWCPAKSANQLGEKNHPWNCPSIHPLQVIFDCEIDREIDLQDVQICFMVWLCLDMWYPVLTGVTSISKRNGEFCLHLSARQICFLLNAIAQIKDGEWGGKIFEGLKRFRTARPGISLCLSKSQDTSDGWKPSPMSFAVSN